MTYKLLGAKGPQNRWASVPEPLWARSGQCGQDILGGGDRLLFQEGCTTG